MSSTNSRTKAANPYAPQRTAPTVTLAAPPPSSAQPPRQPPQSLILGSLALLGWALLRALVKTNNLQTDYNTVTTPSEMGWIFKGMKRTICILAVALALVSVVPAIAGGGSAGFEAMGKPLLAQAPSLARVITSELSIDEHGFMGPGDAPFDGRRLYTYMEFRGRSTSPQQAFTIRIHFTSMRDMTLERIEIIPRKKEANEP